MIQNLFQLVAFALSVLVLATLAVPYFRFKLYVRALPHSVFVFPYFPLIGSFFQELKGSKRDHQLFVRQMSQKVRGKGVLATNLLFNNIIVIIGNQYIKQFYLKAKQHIVQEGTIKAMRHSLFGRALASQDGLYHSNRRKILSRLFNFQFLQSKAQAIYNIVRQFIRPGKDVAVLPLMTNLASRVVVQCFLGASLEGIQVQGRKITHVAAGLLQKQVQVLQNPLFLITGKYAKSVLQTSSAYKAAVKEVVKEAYIKDDTCNFVNKLKGNLGLPQQQQIQQISNQFNVFLAAGTDTTATLLTSCVFYLLKFQHYQHKISEEVKAFSFQKLTANSGKQFELLNSFIKQVQRLNGPAQGIFPRSASSDFYLKDVYVPRGTIIFIRTDFNALSDQFFQNPFQFRPQRWLQNPSNEQYIFLPFSAGHKNCIGQQLALLQVRLTLIHLLKHMHVSGQEGVENLRVKEEGLLVLDGEIWAEFREKAD